MTEIELTTLNAFDAYWIPRGWDKLGPILTESRIDVPRDGSTVTAGHVAIAGVAWAGNRGVSTVEVSISPSSGSDSAETWIPATLSDALSDSTWRQWMVDWNAQPGTYDVAVRATDGHGDVQTADQQPPGPNGATGYHRIYVQVR